MVQRCVTCGSTDHLNEQCTAPGGKKDPNHDQNWEKYRARKAEAHKLKAAQDPQNTPTPGNEPKGKGKGKGKCKGNTKVNTAPIQIL